MTIDWYRRMIDTLQRKEYMHPIGRPVKIANSVNDTTGEPVAELVANGTSEVNEHRVESAPNSLRRLCTDAVDRGRGLPGRCPRCGSPEWRTRPS